MRVIERAFAPRGVELVTREFAPCAEEDARAIPAPTIAFSPAPTATETCFDFVMEDSWGDGWNGAVHIFHDHVPPALAQ